MALTELELELENREIVKRYRQLLRVSNWSREAGDINVIRKAFELAVEAHKDMRRKSGEPYIFHPLAVARIAAEEIGLGTTSIVCALLHDVVEDTHISIAEIKKEFGDKVANIIDGLTKIKGVFDQSSSPQAENFRKMLLTLSDDVRVILIKLCDRLHNMRTLDHMSAKGQLKIASETMYLYAPLAHRLGLYVIKTEMEDLALKYTEPESYDHIVSKLKETSEQRTRYIRKFIKPIKLELDNIGLKYDIKGRPKSIHSILNKMRNQKVEFEQVYDLFAVRIIVDSPPEKERVDCWNVYSVVTSIFRPNPDRLRDWISTPKSNGYESLHTTVMGPQGNWVEVQIRTRRMDEIAEKGYAAHWKYKEESSSESGLDQWLSRVREILENQQENALDFLDDFKLNLFSDEVFVFTPKGELRKLPFNATALDFAFDIHTEIGSSCIGAKVNNKLVPLSHVLNNGDQVEVITSAKQKPSKDWLDFVVTAKAKARIKQLLKDEKRKLSRDGKEILTRKFRNSKVPFNSTNIKIVCNHYNIHSDADLFYLVATGELDRKDIDVKGIINRYNEKTEIAGRTPKQEVKSKPQIKRTGDLIIGDREDLDLDYTFAKCCNPIPGDEVVGFVTVGEGIRIHRTNCKNAIRLMSNYGYRIIKARWAGYPVLSEKSFIAAIEINGVDSMGVVSKVTGIVSEELKVNIKAISFSSQAGTFIGNLEIEIKDTKSLNDLMNKIRSIDPYLKVTRVDVE